MCSDLLLYLNTVLSAEAKISNIPIIPYPILRFKTPYSRERCHLQGILHHKSQVAFFSIQITQLLLFHHANRKVDLFQKYVITFALYILQNHLYFFDTFLVSRRFLIDPNHKTYPLSTSKNMYSSCSHKL